MSNIAYFRISTKDQSIESQRAAMLGSAKAFDKEFKDVGVSGAIPAMERKGFAEMVNYLREGDTLHVYAVDRIGRDAIDVQATAKALLAKGVQIHVHGLGVIDLNGAGALILAVLAQVAQMEKDRINERCQAGRERAKELIATTGKTQHGKESMGRPAKANAEEVKAWRLANKASIATTAKKFSLSIATVKRYCSEKN